MFSVLNRLRKYIYILERFFFFFFVHVKVVLRAVCVVVVAGVGETELLLHLLTSFGPFKKVRKGGVGVCGY